MRSTAGRQEKWETAAGLAGTAQVETISQRMRSLRGETCLERWKHIAATAIISGVAGLNIPWKLRNILQHITVLSCVVRQPVWASVSQCLRLVLALLFPLVWAGCDLPCVGFRGGSDSCRWQPGGALSCGPVPPVSTSPVTQAWRHESLIGQWSQQLQHLRPEVWISDCGSRLSHSLYRCYKGKYQEAATFYLDWPQ